MMRRNVLRSGGIMLLLLLLLAGCAPQQEGETATDTPDVPEPSQSAEQPEDTPAQTEDGFPGSYEVPDGWVKWEKYSTPDKIFFVEAGREDEQLPNNMSIEVRTNRYSADEHENFRNAIVQQLTMQLQGLDATLTGDGTYTEQDYVLYIFTITEEEAVTRQYYIVGDQRYCLIHLTNFSGSEGAYEAARFMADSFVWN